MQKFYELYRSFEDFYQSFAYGNEFEFLYKGKHYCIIPVYDGEEKQSGILIGNSQQTEDVICTSQNELYYAKIEDTFLGEILDEIEIVWYNC